MTVAGATADHKTLYQVAEADVVEGRDPATEYKGRASISDTDQIKAFSASIYRIEVAASRYLGYRSGCISYLKVEWA